MEHVSTLCAISTVGIAPTGFAFGRVDRSSSRPGRFRKKTLPLHDQFATTTDNISPSDINSVLATPFATTTAESPSVANFLRVCESDASQGQTEVKAHRKPSFAAVRFRRRGRTLTGPPRPVFENASIASHIRRPSSSWVRRLSFQPEKRTSCQIPVSPSLSGPASPASPPIQRRPNKLIKRPPSHNADAPPPFGNVHSSSTTPLALRRPVSSYQRSETGGHKATHSLNFEPSMAFNSPTKRADITGLGDDPVWHPYIGVSPEGLSERLARRFSAATRPKDQGPRRIVPNADTAPALLLATSITSKHPAGQANLSESAPASLVQFRNPFGPSVTSQQQPELLLPPEKVHPQASSSDDADTRRPATSTDSTDFDGFHNGSLLYPKRRAVSTPFPPLAKSTGTILTSSRVHDRRNITDSNIFRRPPTAPQAGIPSVTSDLIGPRRKAFSSFSQDYKVDMSHLQNIGSRPFTSDTVPLSRLQGTLRQRPKRHSIAASDPASTVIGSDDTHIFTSGEEDETEFLSDTAFDSIRTHVTTSSNSGLYTPRIQTIFDKDFPSSTAEKSSSISVLKPRGSLVSPTLGKCHCESDVDTTSIPISAPVPDEASGPRDNGSIVSFPSDLTDDEDSRSLLAELPSELSSSSTQLQPLTTSLTSHGVCHKSEIFPSDKPVTSLNLRQSIEHDTRGFTDEMLDSGPKMNIFDWSEQPRSDREAAGSDGRPRTVHGKHAPDVRGSRTTGRKATSTLHLRSQSVPVTRDTPAANEQRQTSGKFGTWGLGSKGVSEDWDSDFDFEDADESTTSETIKPSKTVPRRGMIVPQAIMERQASLHGQFGQVQELTLLVEELKRLRHQGSFLKIVRGPSSELWKEAEGIVNLATLDDDHHNHSPPGSPSSLTFSFEESEGDSSNTNDPWKRTSGGSWMVSLSEHSNSRPTTSPNQEVPIKPNSVLDLIYQQRDSDDSTFTDAHLTRPKKLPFDTQSLRDLVVRAGVVTRALKDVIRKAEGVTTEPKETMHLSDPPFSRIFDLSTSLEACTN